MEDQASDRRAGRRELLPAATSLAGAIALGPTTTAAQGGAGDHAAFARRAEAARARAVAEGDRPYGAIIVREGRIVAESPSRVVTRTDPTAHAEMEAIRDAARALGSSSLAGCVMYSTSIPCPMCQSAAYWAGVSRFFYGDAPTDGGAPRLARY
jgi:tRNA(Arg) A34 adenosine deaminase TadA